MRIYVGTELDWWCENGQRQVGVYEFTDSGTAMSLEQWGVDESGVLVTKVADISGDTFIEDEWDEGLDRDTQRVLQESVPDC